jgi:8-oxo-dGTP pyrophosphatase MutT (NUDIX family)
MGGGILPATIHEGKLYFLFGKEGKYEDTAPGFSDFGGGTDNGESLISTATREGGEEFTGFLGSSAEILKMLRAHGTYNLDLKTNGHGIYRTHIFPLQYNKWLPHYYNNNQRFLQKHLPATVFKTTKIFEKAEIRWICVDDLNKMRPQFRFWYKPMIDQMCTQGGDIKKFVEKGLHQRVKKGTKKKTLRARARRRQTRRNL